MNKEPVKFDGNLLEVDNLTVSFKTARGTIRAADGVSFYLHKGKVLGIVGESGSGKSVTSLALMGLLPDTATIETGRVTFDGQDLIQMSGQMSKSEFKSKKRRIRGGDIAMIFQDPMSALNPCYTVEFQLREAIRDVDQMSHDQRRVRCLELLDQVGIPDPTARLSSYPHQLSGGMSQRVMIAMAIASRPKLLIADEPTTALDVTIQAQILALLKDLQKQIQMSMILITHDISVVATQADHILVMYAGQVVEAAETDELIYNPTHPYTEGLLKSMPGTNTEAQFRSILPSIGGVVPDLTARPEGCQFHPRCSRVEENCRKVLPPLIERKNRRVKCHYPI